MSIWLPVVIALALVSTSCVKELPAAASDTGWDIGDDIGELLDAAKDASGDAATPDGSRPDTGPDVAPSDASPDADVGPAGPPTFTDVCLECSDTCGSGGSEGRRCLVSCLDDMGCAAGETCVSGACLAADECEIWNGYGVGPGCLSFTKYGDACTLDLQCGQDAVCRRFAPATQPVCTHACVLDCGAGWVCDHQRCNPPGYCSNSGAWGGTGYGVGPGCLCGACGPRQVCSNEAAGPTCICSPGYIDSQGRCENVDECAAAPEGCNGVGTCFDKLGSWGCFMDNLAYGKTIVSTEGGLWLGSQGEYGNRDQEWDAVVDGDLRTGWRVLSSWPTVVVVDLEGPHRVESLAFKVWWDVDPNYGALTKLRAEVRAGGSWKLVGEPSATRGVLAELVLPTAETNVDQVRFTWVEGIDSVYAHPQNQMQRWNGWGTLYEIIVRGTKE